MEGGEEEVPAPCSRNWAELEKELVALIFLKAGTIEVLRVGGSVCQSWRRVVKKEEPVFRRRVDITRAGYDYRFLVKGTRLAIDRSGDQLAEFSVERIGDKNLLQYLCERTSVLKKLCLISCVAISWEAIAETAKRQPLLEEIQIISPTYSIIPEILGKECPQLKILKLNGNWKKMYHRYPYDDEALGIAKTMHQLRHLQLIDNRMTNKGLKAIFDGCPHLETLDIRRCNNVLMDDDMKARCAALKTIRLPDDSMYDYEFKAID